MFSDKQNTIANEISFSGIGLHSGKETNVNLYPAPDNHGIIFRRSDIADKNNVKIKFILASNSCCPKRNIGNANNEIKIKIVQILTP